MRGSSLPPSPLVCYLISHPYATVFCPLPHPVSHAFIPYDAQDHRGVFFPTGLERLSQPQPPADSSAAPQAHDHQTAAKAGGSTSGNVAPSPAAGDSLLLTYGKGDNTLMAMTLGPELLQEWLMPIASLQPKDYRFCTVGRGRPLYTISAA